MRTMHLLAIVVSTLFLTGCSICGAWINGDPTAVDCRVADALPYPSGPVLDSPTRCEVDKSAGRPCLPGEEAPHE